MWHKYPSMKGHLIHYHLSTLPRYLPTLPMFSQPASSVCQEQEVWKDETSEGSLAVVHSWATLVSNSCQYRLNIPHSVRATKYCTWWVFLIDALILIINIFLEWVLVWKKQLEAVASIHPVGSYGRQTHYAGRPPCTRSPPRTPILNRKYWRRSLLQFLHSAAWVCTGSSVCSHRSSTQWHADKCLTALWKTETKSTDSDLWWESVPSYQGVSATVVWGAEASTTLFHAISTTETCRTSRAQIIAKCSKIRSKEFGHYLFYITYWILSLYTFLFLIMTACNKKLEKY